MLTRDEREQVQLALTAALAGEINPREAIKAVFLTDGLQFVTQLPTTLNSADQYASFTINICLGNRWTHDPAWLDLLLAYLITNKGQGPLAPLLDRVRLKVDPNPSPYSASWLVTERPFFGRSELRGCVQDLIESDARTILKIAGDVGGFGRSYSRSFLEHLQAVSPNDTQVLALFVSPKNGPSYDGRTMASEVAAQLGLAEPIPPIGTNSAYPADVGRYILRNLMAIAGRWFIVLDGFGQENLHSETREAVEFLATNLPTGQYRRRLRLVLIDYPQVLPNPVSQADWHEDTVRPAASVVATDLEPVVKAWEAKRKSLGLPDLEAGAISQVASRIVQLAPVAGKERLEKMNERLSKLMRFPDQVPQ
jgi:hypothetical protein